MKKIVLLTLLGMLALAYIAAIPRGARTEARDATIVDSSCEPRYLHQGGRRIGSPTHYLCQVTFADGTHGYAKAATVRTGKVSVAKDPKLAYDTYVIVD